MLLKKLLLKNLIQNDVNSENIFEVVKSFLVDEQKYDALKNELGKIKSKLKTEGNPSKKAAEIIYAELNVN